MARLRPKLLVRKAYGPSQAPLREDSEDSAEDDSSTDDEEVPEIPLFCGGHSFTVLVKDNQFFFAGGSKFLRIPRSFQRSQYGDRFGAGPAADYVELSIESYPKSKYLAVLARNERTGTLQIGNGFEDIACKHRLVPGTRLFFTQQVDAASNDFIVDICYNNYAGESELEGSPVVGEGDQYCCVEYSLLDDTEDCYILAGNWAPVAPEIAPVLQPTPKVDRQKRPKVSKTAQEIAKRKRYGLSKEIRKRTGLKRRCLEVPMVQAPEARGDWGPGELRSSLRF